MHQLAFKGNGKIDQRSGTLWRTPDQQKVLQVTRTLNMVVSSFWTLYSAGCMQHTYRFVNLQLTGLILRMLLLVSGQLPFKNGCDGQRSFKL
jgi:hypothetical protein